MYIENKFTKAGSDWFNNVTLVNTGLFVTYNFWENLSSGKDDNTRYEVQKINRRLIRRLEKNCNVHQLGRLERVIVTETDKSRNHCHMIVETPVHLEEHMMVKNIIGSLYETKGLGKIDIRGVSEKPHLIDYLYNERLSSTFEWETLY